MVIASVILSTIALIMSMASIVWLLAQKLSSHQISYINPMQDMMDKIGMGKPQMDEYRGLEDGIPADADEFPNLKKK